MTVQSKSQDRLHRSQQMLAALKLDKIEAHDVPDIAEVHYKELSWSFNGQLGAEHMRELYDELAKDPHFFGYAIRHQSKVLGFVTATTDSAAIRTRIQSVYFRKMHRVMGLMLRRPSFLVGALESRFLVPRAFDRLGSKAEWLTFVTNSDSGYLSPFVAIRLIDAVRDHFRELGTEVYLAQGVKQNPKAMRFYDKLGWNIAERLYVHNIYVYRSDAPDASSVLEGK